MLRMLQALLFLYLFEKCCLPSVVAADNEDIVGWLLRPLFIESTDEREHRAGVTINNKNIIHIF